MALDYTWERANGLVLGSDKLFLAMLFSNMLDYSTQLLEAFALVHLMP
jgi:hypothetical protein